MAHSQASIEIKRPADEVFAYAADVGHFPEWSSEAIEAEQISEGPLGAGTRVRAVGKFLGRRLEQTIEVTAYEPPARFAFKALTGPIKSENSLTFESVGDSTKVTEAVDFDSGGFFGVADPLFARMLGRQFDTNLHAMKDLVEAKGGNN